MLIKLVCFLDLINQKIDLFISEIPRMQVIIQITRYH